MITLEDILNRIIFDSDRASGILGHILLEYLLKNISKNLTNKYDDYVKRMFNNKREVNDDPFNCLDFFLLHNIINEKQKQYLQHINKIRNEFAHHLQNDSFETERIKELAYNFKDARDSVVRSGIDYIQNILAEPKNLFIYTVTVLATELFNIITKTDQIKESPQSIHQSILSRYSFDHFYSLDAEHHQAIDKFNYRETNEKFWIYKEYQSDSVKFLRAYHPIIHDHFYTIDDAEFEKAISDFGYNPEDPIGFLPEQPNSSTIPLFRCYSNTKFDHMYTTKMQLLDKFKPFGYTKEAEYNVFPNETNSNMICVYCSFKSMVQNS